MKANAKRPQKIAAAKHARPVIRTPQKRMALRDMLGLDLDPAPRGAWEGKLVQQRGAAARKGVVIEAALRMVGDVIEGEGVAPGFPKPQPNARFTIEGVLEEGHAKMTLWFDAPLVAQTPFLLEGMVDADERNITGTWTCGCFQPETCTCGGTRGTFHFHRIG
jgi:hypothetical protein